jgi:group I intron endonuclease
MIIYKTTNNINGKIYIGQDKNNNPSYYGSGKKLLSAIKKYGKENFTKEILEECVNEDYLNEREIFWISYYNSRDRHIGYNISEGGKEGDRNIGQDIAKSGIYNYWVEKYGKVEADKRRELKIQKIRKHNQEIGTPLTKKGRYALWIEKYGKEIADQKLTAWKLKISEYQQYKLENGWKHSDEAKEKISKSSKGRKLSEETKNKMRKPKPEGFSEKLSKAKKGIKPSKPSLLRKPVEQYDLFGNFIKSWESITEAINGTKILNIGNVCKGKAETAGGYKWKYKNKTNEK